MPTLSNIRNTVSLAKERTKDPIWWIASNVITDTKLAVTWKIHRIARTMVQEFAFHFWQKQISKTTKRVGYSAEMNVRSSSLSIENLSSLVVLYICEWRNSPPFDAQSIAAICDNYANQQRLSLLRLCEWNAKRIATSVVSHVFGSLSWWAGRL